MSTTRSRSNASSPAAGASSSAAGSPVRLTRSATKRKQGLLSVALDNPEISKKRKKTTTTVIVDHTGRGPPLFRTKAMAIRVGLLALVDHVDVQINGDDGRAGCFVVRREEGQIYVELLNMRRPYTQLNNLNVERLVARIARSLLDNTRYYESTDDEE